MSTSRLVIYSSILSLCCCWMPKTDFTFLYSVVLNKGYVPGQKHFRTCAAIEVVEEQYYLLPIKCFDTPSRNLEMKVALLKKRKLIFRPLFYEKFFLRWNSVSEFALLEKSYEEDFDVVVNDRSKMMTKQSIDPTSDFNIAAPSKTSSKQTNTVPDMPDDDDIPKTAYSKWTGDVMNHYSPNDYLDQRIIPEPPLFYVSNDREEREIKNIQVEEHQFPDPRFPPPPIIPDDDDLPSRILLTTPNSTLLSDCLVLGWGTFFSNGTTREKLRNSKLSERKVNSIDEESPTSSYYGEIWFTREEKPYVEDLGSPLICKVRDVQVIIGIFIGGNDSFRHEKDCFKSFRGEFIYITRWAIGTNVSLTGDPRDWILWPTEYIPELKMSGDTLLFESFLFFIVLIYFVV